MTHASHNTLIQPADILLASKRLHHVVRRTPLIRNTSLSKLYDCNVWLKREDLQVVRSYKLRGAYNMMSRLSAEEMQRGVVCASAGNHAQGFAYSCKKLGARGVVFMPVITPRQKVSQTMMFGEGFVDIKLVGDTFDDCAAAAKQFTVAQNMTFIPPFDHPHIIEGRGVGAHHQSRSATRNRRFPKRAPTNRSTWVVGAGLLLHPACHTVLAVKVGAHRRCAGGLSGRLRTLTAALRRDPEAAGNPARHFSWSSP